MADVMKVYLEEHNPSPPCKRMNYQLKPKKMTPGIMVWPVRLLKPEKWGIIKKDTKSKRENKPHILQPFQPKWRHMRCGFRGCNKK